MNDGLIPNRYAKALYKQAASQGQDAEVYGQMKSLEAAFAASRELKQVACNPFVQLDKKRTLLLAAAGAQPGGPLDKFISLNGFHATIAQAHNSNVDFLEGFCGKFEQSSHSLCCFIFPKQIYKIRENYIDI